MLRHIWSADCYFSLYVILSKTASVWEIHLKKRDQRVLFQRTEGTVTDNE